MSEIKVEDPGNVEPQGVDAADLVKVTAKLYNWKNYVIYALMAAIAVASVVIIWQRGTVAKYENDVIKAEQDVRDIKFKLQIAEANEKSCRVNLAEQNKRIGEAGKRYDTLQAEFDELEKRIADGEFYKPADNVRNQPTPKTCQEALDFMNTNLP